ncbi:MAG: hypothetical protein HZB57_01140 [Gammaproteobacteria bacterium]|nr:hypothetical protein [Gammaproteobacteria bacterium]
MSARGLFFTAAVTAGLGLGGITASHADTLVIDAVRQSAGVECPAKGQSMADVEARFGTQNSKEPGIGQPPITRWVYAGFTVYFEGDTVLHAVVHR